MPVRQGPFNVKPFHSIEESFIFAEMPLLVLRSRPRMELRDELDNEDDLVPATPACETSGLPGHALVDIPSDLVDALFGQVDGAFGGEKPDAIAPPRGFGGLMIDDRW